MHTLTVTELSAGLHARKFSSLELTLHLLGRIETLGPELNAFVTVTADRALEDARAADVLLARGDGGPLTGVPIVHKDIFCTDGIRTTCSSKMLANFVAPYDATRGGALPEPCCSARPTWTSSRWARRMRRAISDLSGIPGTWRECRVALPGDPRRRSRRVSRPLPAAPTPVARYASRPRSRT